MPHSLVCPSCVRVYVTKLDVLTFLLVLLIQTGRVTELMSIHVLLSGDIFNTRLIITQMAVPPCRLDSSYFEHRVCVSSWNQKATDDPRWNSKMKRHLWGLCLDGRRFTLSIWTMRGMFHKLSSLSDRSTAVSCSEKKQLRVEDLYFRPSRLMKRW